METAKKMNKKLVLGIAAAVILVLVGGIFFFEKTSVKVFTKSEYVKEVIVQNKAFETSLDNFLDQVYAYDSSKAATEKFQTTAEKFPKFVSDLEEKLGARVPSEVRPHYDQMIAAYKVYLEAIDLYKRAVPKNIGEERETMMKEAAEKLSQAKEAMGSLKNQ